MHDFEIDSVTNEGPEGMSATYTIGTVLFPGFELLDVFGPLEMYGMYPDIFDIRIVAETGHDVASAQGPRSVVDDCFSQGIQYDVVMVPGGPGTRTQIANERLQAWLREQAAQAKFVTSVCTGSALLARAGILDGRHATSNKQSFSWVRSQGENVHWEHAARWVVDDTLYTSSGVSAGIDMSLAVIERVMDKQAALDAARWAEYEWHQDSTWDPFAVPIAPA